MALPLEAPQLIGLTDGEEQKKEEDSLFEWIRQHAAEIPSITARAAAQTFVKSALTIKKIAKKVEKSSSYLADNFDVLDDDDMEAFVQGLVQSGLLGRSALPSSPVAMVSSSSAPQLTVGIAVSGTFFLTYLFLSFPKVHIYSDFVLYSRGYLFFIL